MSELPASGNQPKRRSPLALLLIGLFFLVAGGGLIAYDRLGKPVWGYTLATGVGVAILGAILMLAWVLLHWRGARWVPLTLAILVVGGAAVAMLTFLGFSMGPEALTVGLVAAILPVPVLVACFLWLDRYEPEPVRFLLFAFGWGAFVATGVALVVNSFASGWGNIVTVPNALVGVLVAPFIEELMKALGPLLILWRRRVISGVTDGMVYCGLSAVGFAMVENILYLGDHAFLAGNEQYGPATGTQLVFVTFIGRIFLSGFAHPLFTSMTGIAIGIAARSSHRWVRFIAPLPGLILAMMLHGSWNLMSILSASISPYIFLYGYIAVMVPVFLTVLGVALWVRAHEGRLTLKVLPAYARAGWFTPPEVAAMGSLGRRHAARVWAKRVAGDRGRKAMKAFQFAATRLALVRDSLDRGVDDTPEAVARSVREEHELLAEIGQARQVYVGRDPQMPPARWTGDRYELMFPDGVVRVVPAPAEPVVPIPVPLPSYRYF